MLASSFSKCLQTLYLIIHSGSLPGFIVKLDVYSFEKAALLSLMEESEQSSLCPAPVLISLPLHIDFEWSGYIATEAWHPEPGWLSWGLEEAAVFKSPSP